MNFEYWKKNKNRVHPPYVLYDMKATSLPFEYVDIHVTVPRPQDIQSADASTWKHVTFAWYQSGTRKQIHCYIGVLNGKYVPCSSDKLVRTLDSFNRYYFPKVVEDMVALGVLP